MRLLIDGYNLLHATDLFGSGELEGTLRGARDALITFLAERLTERERQATVIVFDASDAPAHLPDRYDHQKIDIRFARGYADADSMIEAILEEAVGTRQMVVVSGDRRVQRAARSQGARPLDSHVWFAELRRRPTAPHLDPPKPETSVEGNAYWVREFTDPELLESLEQASATPPPPAPPVKKKETPEKENFGKGIFDPFPPGYGEDLLDGD